MNSPAPQHFTARQIADALGLLRQSVQRTLRSISPDKVEWRAGNEVKFWSLASLPENFRCRLQAAAQAHGHRDPAQLLMEKPARYEPAVSLAECAPAAVEKAIKLRAALERALMHRNLTLYSASELESLALADYQREFGHAVSARHIRDLISRTIERAGAADDLRRLELYLDEKPACKSIAAPVQEAGSFPQLERILASVANPAALTKAEERALWLAAIEHYAAQTDLGETPRTVKDSLLDFLMRHAPGLAVSRDALRVAFVRKLARWQEADNAVKALADKRADANRSRAFEIPAEDRDIVIAHSVMACGGRVAQGWRECLQNGWLTEPTASRFLANPSRKSHVPASIRDAVRYEVKMMESNHHGPTQTRDNGAYLERYWGCVPSLAWYCADDCTLPVYYYVPNGNGWFSLVRGQFLLMIDTRTTCILGYALMPERNYNARVIRTLITRVCDGYGLPRKGFYFERGVWKDAKILTGDRNAAALDWNEAELGLREFGLEFIHAIRARSKPVERVWGALQNMVEGDPGYCGRNEMVERFEVFQKEKRLVESGKLDPRGKFYSQEQWEARLEELCARYNSEPCEGKMTGGLPPEDAMERFKAPNDPGIRFDASCRFLLAHHKRPVQVSANGITLRFGKQSYNYRNEQTGELRGQTVLAWFNPDAPEILTVTDMERRNAFCIERSEAVPAIGAEAEIMAQEMGKVEAHMSYARTRYRILKSKYRQQFRHNLVDRHTRELGEEIAAQTAGIKTRQKEIRKAAKVYNELGLSLDGEVTPEQLGAAVRLKEILGKGVEE